MPNILVISLNTPLLAYNITIGWGGVVFQKYNLLWVGIGSVISLSGLLWPKKNPAMLANSVDINLLMIEVESYFVVY